MLNDKEKRALSELIRLGVKWLDSDQDPEAILSHHGISTRVGKISVSLIPQSSGGHPAFVFDHEDKHAIDMGKRAGYTKDDIEQFKWIVGEHAQFLNDWNGVGCGTYSLAIQDYVGSGVDRCLQNYREAGPEIFDAAWWKVHPKKPERPEGWH